MKTLAHQRDKEEILQRLRNVRPESVRRWGRMSAHQMVCHLSDAFRVVIAQKPVSQASGVFQRTVLKWTALHLPLQWPRGIPTRPEVDQEVGGTKPADFAGDIAELEALLELITRQPSTVAWQPHPIFGRMSEAEYLRWAYLHMDHHLRQFGH
ncbi:MAG TPA: DUF1569 domain-containing protein [Vicinamibacterales bacterium]|jgi:hypothetical protein